MTTLLQLLDARRHSNETTQEVLYALLCMVVALDKATIDATDNLLEIYWRESEFRSIVHVLYAVDEFNMWKSATRDKIKVKFEQKEDERKRIASQNVQADLTRLLHSTSRVETQSRLQDQLETLRRAQKYALISVLPPKHLQIRTLEEDVLEFRRNTKGVAQVWGRNVLGEHYAPKTDPLRYLHTHTVSDLFKRMKRVVREDLSSRDKRRVEVLNAHERERKRMIESLGILLPEQQLEAKFDKLLN